MSAEAAIGRAQALASESFIQATGPGGQNVNQVATAVQLRVDIYALRLAPEVFQRLKLLAGSRLNVRGELVLAARRFRTQEANRADARERLAELIAEAQNPLGGEGGARAGQFRLTRATCWGHYIRIGLADGAGLALLAGLGAADAVEAAGVGAASGVSAAAVASASGAGVALASSPRSASSAGISTFSALAASPPLPP